MDSVIDICGERFYEIPDTAVRDILPQAYYVSMNARVFSAVSKRMMNPTLAKDTGYLCLNFKTKGGKSRTQNLHRLMMLTFRWYPGAEQDQVNHKDGNKLNCALDNLEWISLIGNNEHAQESGLLPSGEDCEWSKLTEEQVRNICQHLVDRDYGTLANLAAENGVSVTTIGDIARRISWKHISCNYDFNYEIRGHFTENQVHYMCQVFEMHKEQSFNYNYFYIIFNLALPDNRNIRTRILKIYNKEPQAFAHITSQYNY